MAQSEFTRTLRWQVSRAKEKEADDAAAAAAKSGDMVAAAHHNARSRAFYESTPDAQREVDEQVVSQLRQSLGHRDPDVRASARRALEELGVYGL